MYKQLNDIDRLYIETSLNQNSSITQIAQALNRPVMTISREIRRNRVFKENQYDKNQCSLKTECRKRNVCGIQTCHKRCGSCNLCNKVCPSFEKISCKTRDRAPYACNACKKKNRCTLDKFFYLASPAHTSATERLSSSRSIIQLNEEELATLDNEVSKRLKMGQPLYHIIESSDLPVSQSTVYRYIDQGILDARNIDLPRKVGRRVRTGRKRRSAEVVPNYRIKRTYADYNAYMALHPDLETVQMDLVEGSGKKNLLTFTFVHSRLLLAFLIPDKSNASIKNAFDSLEQAIGHSLFRKAFKVILTDNGPEFQKHENLEFTSGGQRRCRIFYCDPYSSWQKGACENNHINIRLFLHKGSDFDGLSQNKVNRMLCNINSTIRKSVKEDAPFNRLSPTMSRIVKKLGLVRINPENVALRQSVLK